ncbi:hypothetical protein ACQPYA_00325 [Micromonospora sp. CA-263727]|uniref:hypothetical protein n=1 Tax=Micromonospora sp. CA-263727 TaxID=3239967 RepID=UPI003D91BC6A
MAIPLALLLVALAGGCQWSSLSVVHVTISDPVWSNDGWVYYLREEASDGRQLWRQQPARRSGELVLDQDAAKSVCLDGAFSFLHRSPAGGLRVAVECDSGTRTELVAYSDGRRQLEPHASVSFLGDVALVEGEATGYAEVSRECGMAIQSLVDGELRDLDSVITVDGKALNISGGGDDCSSVAWVKSPAVARGKLFFLVASNSFGKLPVTTSDVLEGFTWQLVQWDPESGSTQFVAEIPGIADLAANGQEIIVAVHSRGKGDGVWFIDAASGKMLQVVDGEEAYHPDFSPDGKDFVYVEDLGRLRFGSLPVNK